MGRKAVDDLLLLRMETERFQHMNAALLAFVQSPRQYGSQNIACYGKRLVVDQPNSLQADFLVVLALKNGIGEDPRVDFVGYNPRSSLSQRMFKVPIQGLTGSVSQE